MKKHRPHLWYPSILQHTKAVTLNYTSYLLLQRGLKVCSRIGHSYRHRHSGCLGGQRHLHLITNTLSTDSSWNLFSQTFLQLSERNVHIEKERKRQSVRDTHTHTHTHTHIMRKRERATEREGDRELFITEESPLLFHSFVLKSLLLKCPQWSSPLCYLFLLSHQCLHWKQLPLRLH